MNQAIARGLLSAAIALLAPAASATAITATYAGSANFGSGAVGYVGGSVAPNPNSSTTLTGVSIGGNSFVTNDRSFEFSSTGQFNTWCVDIYHWLAGGSVTYQVEPGGASLAASLSMLRPGILTGEQRVGDLVTLANAVYRSVDTQTESAAFQLAVWAITYGAMENSLYVVNASNPGFRVSSLTAGSPAASMANEWLANLWTASPTGNYALTYLNDGKANTTQDQVVIHAVPAPASLLSLGIGLFALGLSRRVSRQRARRPS